MKYAATYRQWLLGQRAAQDGNYAAVGAWLMLNVHAADLELGEGEPPHTDVPVGTARIVACEEWSDRRWLTRTAVDRVGVRAAVEAGLAEWDGNDLLVHGYDLKGQQAAESHRVAGRKGGRPKGPTRAAQNQEVSQTEDQGKNRRETKPEPPALPSPVPPDPTFPHPTEPHRIPGCAQPSAGAGAQSVVECGSTRLPSPRAQTEIAALESAYPPELVRAVREGCVRGRSCGSMPPEVWLRALRKLSTLGSAHAAMETFAQEYAPRGGYDERYLLGIARRMSEQASSSTGRSNSTHRAMVPATSADEWEEFHRSQDQVNSRQEQAGCR